VTALTVARSELRHLRRRRCARRFCAADGLKTDIHTRRRKWRTLKERTMPMFQFAQHSIAQPEASLEYMVAVDARQSAGDTGEDGAALRNELHEQEKEADDRAHELAAQSSHDGQSFFDAAANFLIGGDSGAQDSATARPAFEWPGGTPPAGSDSNLPGGSEGEVQPNREFNALFLRMVDGIAAYDDQQHHTNEASGISG
jgi:hypothetical protein